MTREEYIQNNQESMFRNNNIYSEIKYTCECGGNVRKRLDIVLTSYPPKYQYECDKCSKVEYFEF